jgi:hypothetical protein
MLVVAMTDITTLARDDGVLKRLLQPKSWKSR